jgi:hypothetical protein
MRPVPDTFDCIFFDDDRGGEIARRQLPRIPVVGDRVLLTLPGPTSSPNTVLCRSSRVVDVILIPEGSTHSADAFIRLKVPGGSQKRRDSTPTRR